VSQPIIDPDEFNHNDSRYRTKSQYVQSNSPPPDPNKSRIASVDTRRSHKVIQYYLDPDRKQPAPTDDNGNLLLNFGTVLQSESKKIKLYATNTIEYNIQLEPIIENNEPDLKITRYPPILRPGEIAEVDIVFSPDPDRITPLNAGFDFRKIILTDRG
jgi:hypothetical protein